jgi:tripartite-type tricarboxylate transporter receptor subunit TctC
MKKILPVSLMTVLAVSLILGIWSRSSAAAESAADFFKRNVVTMVIGFNPGAGSDYAGRLLASYWSAATDGGAMIVKNMTGAGGLVATNFVNSAKPDGLTIGFGMFGNAYLSPYLTKDPAARFDFKKLNWLVGVFNEPFGLHVSVKRPYASVEDLKKAKGLKIAALTPFGPDSIAEIPFIDFLNLDAKIVTGYKGGSDMALAAGKGEIDIAPLPTGTGLDSMNKGFVKPPVVIMGNHRVDVFRDSPAFSEVVDFTPERKAFFKATNTASYILRIGAAPPGVSEDRLKFMRDAFARIVAMSGFKQQSKLSFPLGPTPLVGDELIAFVTEAGNINIEPVNNLIRKHLAIR